MRQEPEITSEDKKNIKYGRLLSNSLRVFFKDALRISLKNPAQAFFFLKTVIWQRQAAKVRHNWRSKGINVPPIMVYSITNRCNLKCKGCYHHNLRESSGKELSAERMKGIITEAKELGISFIVLAGGEPLVRPEILDITGNFPEIVFLIFTNGLLIDGEILLKLRKQKNLVPIISLEGYEKDTDDRRGKGVYEALQKIIGRLKSKRAFFGVSLTVTKYNFDTIINHRFMKKLTDLGCKIFFLPEYTAIRGGTEDWVPTEKQRSSTPVIMRKFRAQFPAIFVALPSDEEEFGGCLSAGRGFVHVSAEGNLEPCPFAPYSDTNLKDTPLKEALQSEFLRTIRQNHEQLHETEGGCALWVKRDWIQSLLK
jgi:MoaA/NifB/PqqE/SkfB family radical SAM enzyme